VTGMMMRIEQPTITFTRMVAETTAQPLAPGRPSPPSDARERRSGGGPIGND
jgi:hypothetical protein